MKNSVGPTLLGMAETRERPLVLQITSTPTLKNSTGNAFERHDALDSAANMIDAVVLRGSNAQWHASLAQIGERMDAHCGVDRERQAIGLGYAAQRPQMRERFTRVRPTSVKSHSDKCRRGSERDVNLTATHSPHRIGTATAIPDGETRMRS